MKVPPGLEPRTFCVLSRRDNHYTTEPHVLKSEVQCDQLYDYIIRKASGRGYVLCTHSAIYVKLYYQYSRSKFKQPF